MEPFESYLHQNVLSNFHSKLWCLFEVIPIIEKSSIQTLRKHLAAFAEIRLPALFQGNAALLMLFTRRRCPGLSGKVYDGQTVKFKDRYNAHRRAFEKEDSTEATPLSNYIWTLKKEGRTFEVKWKILGRAAPYRSGAGKCLLCLKEKYHIAKEDPKKLLNSRSEILSKCIHKFNYELRPSKRKKKKPLTWGAVQSPFLKISHHIDDIEISVHIRVISCKFKSCIFFLFWTPRP